MLSKRQKHHLYVALARSCDQLSAVTDAWLICFKEWAREAGEDDDGSGPLDWPEPPQLPGIYATTPRADGNANGNHAKVDIIAKRQPGTPEGYYTLPEVIELTGYARKVLMSMILSGTLKAKRGPGNKRPRYYISEAEVERLLSEQEEAKKVRSVTVGKPVTYPQPVNGNGTPGAVPSQPEGRANG